MSEVATTQAKLPSPMERNLFFAEQVDQKTIGELTKSIININASDKHLKKLYALNDLKYKPKPIKIYIDSYGGYVYQCFGLLSIMKSSKTPIHTIATGAAMSCGFMILISGHKRMCYELATPLYHQVSSGHKGKAKELEEGMVETKRLQKMIEKITLERTKITKKRLQESYDKKEDWFMSSKEALKLGVVDKILK